MAKTKKVFFCTSCGNEFPKWMGKCPICNEWNTFKEEIVHKNQKKERTTREKALPATARKISEIAIEENSRYITKNGELNRVLGGGIMTGSIVLVGGQPGIGKSTLLLQVSLESEISVLYASGEESEVQIKMRADRIAESDNQCYVLADTNSEKIIQQAKELEVGMVIIDSIQTMSVKYVEASPGSISQIRETAALFQDFAKTSGVPVFLIGHITKDGSIAGPKLLEHMVDVVLQFEGDRNYTYRILRTTKNRFGSTDEIGIFTMDGKGLTEVTNPSELLISQNEEDLSGAAICASLEGMRPLLIEIQGLVTPSVYGTPQRTATGFDLRRMSMLLAVLEKRCGLPFGMNDVFLNIAGGIKISDPAADLAVITALISSIQDIPVARDICFAGEVGLSGEVRAVSRIEQRVQEADRLGFDTIILPNANVQSIKNKNFNIQIIPISRVEELLEVVFG